MSIGDTLPLWQNILFATIAPQMAVIFTNPFDTAKVRLQLQKDEKIYKSSIDCIRKIYKHEGVTGLQKGLYPAILREGSKNIFRLGLFHPILNILHNKEKEKFPPIWKRFIAGATSGVMGALACNPFELIKTRLQAKAAGILVIGTQHNYNNVGHAMVNMVKTEGILSLWSGSGFSALRSFLGTGANLASYSWMRENILEYKILKDGILTDCLCSFLSSFFTALAMNPTDVIRTRIYNEIALGNTQYKSGTDVFLKILKHEGLLALYKGFVTGFMRLGPHITLTFVFFEQMKRSSINYRRNNLPK